jgi:MYXO-CTERM domain-containing protein
MKNPDEVDARLAARFEQEHRQVPGDVFVDATMRSVRSQRRRWAMFGGGWRAAALVIAVLASPWLIDGVVRLNSAVAYSLTWAKGQPVAWVLGALAVLAALTMRRRRR